MIVLQYNPSASPINGLALSKRNGNSTIAQRDIQMVKENTKMFHISSRKMKKW